MLNKLSELGGVDILHVQHEYGIFGLSKSILEAVLEARNERLAKKVVLTMHTVYHPFSGKDAAIKFQEMLNEVDAIIVHSYLQEFELQCQGINPSKIYRIPHGTLVNPYLGTPRHILARDLGLKTSNLVGTVLAIPGFLRRDKGIDIMLRALEVLNSENFTLLIAGEPQGREDLEVLEMIKSVKSGLNLVHLEKYLSSDEILKIVALADAIILPYRDLPGAYGVSDILHLSIGSLKPIIGTRVPRLVELYQYAPRLTISPEDHLELADKINWLVRNYDHAVAYMATLYGYAARTQWYRMARRHLELYRKLLKAN